MKRLLTIVIAMSYLCLSIGITVHIHYCMGRIVGTSFIEHDDDHHCSHCGMKKTSSKKGCCKDEHKLFKSTNDQHIAKLLTLQAGFGELVIIPQTSFLHEVYFASVYKNPSAKANAPPPRVPDCPLYISLRNFRV